MQVGMEGNWCTMAGCDCKEGDQRRTNNCARCGHRLEMVHLPPKSFELFFRLLNGKFSFAITSAPTGSYEISQRPLGCFLVLCSSFDFD